jgi:hypothetical protein
MDKIPIEYVFHKWAFFILAIWAFIIETIDLIKWVMN